jgi:hypothetical protein
MASRTCGCWRFVPERTHVAGARAARNSLRLDREGERRLVRFPGARARPQDAPFRPIARGTTVPWPPMNALASRAAPGPHALLVSKGREEGGLLGSSAPSPSLPTGGKAPDSSLEGGLLEERAWRADVMAPLVWRRFHAAGAAAGESEESERASDDDDDDDDAPAECAAAVASSKAFLTQPPPRPKANHHARSPLDPRQHHQQTTHTGLPVWAPCLPTSLEWRPACRAGRRFPARAERALAS